MGANSKIEWCDHTFNPWIGCTQVSPGCGHCYAERDFDLRKGVAKWGPGNPRHRTSGANWKMPLRWNAQRFAQCKSCGHRGHVRFTNGFGEWHCGACTGVADLTRRRVFCASLADVFDNEAPIEWLADLLDLIRRTPNLDWLLLTKRIGNGKRRLHAAADHVEHEDSDRADDLWQWIDDWVNCDLPPPNIWIGATICNQEEADRDIPKLLATPATVRFLSIEPMLGPISFRWAPYAHESAGQTYREYLTATGSVNEYEALRKIDWVICGGESGPHARPMHPDWVRSLRDQCAEIGVPFHFKQWGEWYPGGSANYAIGPAKYRYGRVAGVSMLNDGRHCLSLDADNPSGRATVIDAQALAEWHLVCERAESKGEPMDPLGYQWMHRIGRKAAGRMLDGQLHDGFPKS